VAGGVIDGKDCMAVGYTCVYTLIFRLIHGTWIYEGVSKSFRTGLSGARTANGTALCH
jgi:cytochrome b